VFKDSAFATLGIEQMHETRIGLSRILSPGLNWWRSREYRDDVSLASFAPPDSGAGRLDHLDGASGPSSAMVKFSGRTPQTTARPSEAAAPLQRHAQAAPSTRPAVVAILSRQEIHRGRSR